MTVRITGGSVAEFPLEGERLGLVLTLTGRGGLWGQGEASPLPGYSPDTASAARDALAAFLAGPRPTVHLDAPLAPQVEAVAAPLAEASPAAAFAAETALLDLAGRRLGRPLWALLAEDREEPPPPVALAALLEAESAGPLLAAARAALTRGISTFKVKVGRQPFREELALLFQLRHLTGYGVALRLDANGRFAAEAVRDRLLALAALHTEFVEEPAAAVAWPYLKGSPVPLALDESLQGAEGWNRGRAWLREGIARVVVLKPATLGGLLRCLGMAREAVRLGATPVVTHTLDGPVALTAAAHLALALPQRRAACGLDRHAGLERWPAADLPWHQRTAVAPPDTPGLGLPALVPGVG